MLRRRREATALVAALSSDGNGGGAHRAAAVSWPPFSWLLCFALRQRGRRDDAFPGFSVARRLRGGHACSACRVFPDSRDSSGAVVDDAASTLATTLVCWRAGRRVIPRAPGRVLLALLRPGLPVGGRGGRRPVPFSGGWGTQKVAWSRGRVALFENYAARQCPPSTVSERRHEGRPSLRSGDGQSGGGQESRRRGSEPCSAGVDKPGEPSGDQKDILLSPPTSPPVATHTGRAPGRGGGEPRSAGGR